MNTKNRTIKKIGKIFEIDERKFYPIIQISTIENDRSFSELLSPVAFLIVEPEKKYILPLIEEEIDNDEIIKLVFPDKIFE
jgi:hypothetical protein